MKDFAVIGAAGYIAPRHFQAIRETGNRLVAALDKSDSVGIIDSYFPNADFFTEFERFDRHIDKLRRARKKVDYVSICSPNYLHDAHVRFALRSEADAICEKPLVLNPWNIEGLKEVERDTGRRINTILQLRLHPKIMDLKKRIESECSNNKHEVDLTYITSRGKWYLASWKGDDSRSGGVATNIGVHFFDMLHFVFGRMQVNELHYRTPETSAGYLEFERARVRWFLSVDSEFLPNSVVNAQQRTYRSITVDGEEVEFSGGFTDLHVQSYQKILEGNGFGLDDNYTCIEAVSSIRSAEPKGLTGEYHPFLRAVRSKKS